MGAKERPTVEVGMRIRIRDASDSDPHGFWAKHYGKTGVVERVDRHADRPYGLRFDDGTTEDSGLLPWNVATYLGGPPSGAEGVHWERWLPPRYLPRREPTDWKVGAVYAMSDVTFGAVVGRVKSIEGSGRGAAATMEPLAGGWMPGWRPNTDGMGRYAVLVQDVGCDPIAPEILYGTLTDTATGGPAPHDREAPLPVVHHRFVGEKRDVGTGAALSCLQLIQARKPPEPWRPSIDEWDLLPDVDVRR